jgi:4-aminobutyrate aminotransferase/(S)-3-amino-2-methylpropionate transaminase
VEVCELLNKHTPGNFKKKSVLFNSGAEAVENAVKIARKATRKNGIVVFDHAYHGRTNLTFTMNFKSAPYGNGFGPTAPSIQHVPMSYPYRDPQGMTGVEAAQRSITYIEKRVGVEDLAAIVIEPIQGEGGFIVPAEGFLKTLSDWAPESGSRASTSKASSQTSSLSPRELPAVCRSQQSPVAQKSWMLHTLAALVEPSVATQLLLQRLCRS